MRICSILMTSIAPTLFIACTGGDENARKHNSESVTVVLDDGSRGTGISADELILGTWESQEARGVKFGYNADGTVYMPQPGGGFETLNWEIEKDSLYFSIIGTEERAGVRIIELSSSTFIYEAEKKVTVLEKVGDRTDMLTASGFSRQDASEILRTSIDIKRGWSGSTLTCPAGLVGTLGGFNYAYLTLPVTVTGLAGGGDGRTATFNVAIGGLERGWYKAEGKATFVLYDDGWRLEGAVLEKCYRNER